MGLQPRENSRLASRPVRRSSNSDSDTSPKHSTSRRLSVPNSKADLDRLQHVHIDPKLTRPRANMAASSPRRPARYSTGDVPVIIRGASGSASPRRPNRHSFSMGGAQKIKEEGSDGEDEVDGGAVFDITRLASSPKPPRKVPVRPLRHSVCVPPSIDHIHAQEMSETPPIASAADRKQKRVRFSVPDIRLTEEQLEELAATASAAAQDRENQLAAPCSDIFRKTMLDMQFLSLEQRRKNEAADEDLDSDTRSSSPSNDS